MTVPPLPPGVPSVMQIVSAEELSAARGAAPTYSTIWRSHLMRLQRVADAIVEYPATDYTDALQALEVAWEALAAHWAVRPPEEVQ